jgi:hypothetical protein
LRESEGFVAFHIPAKLFGKYWFPLEMPRHMALYSPKTVRRAFTESGFRVDKMMFRRRGETMAKSVDYLPAGKVKSLCRLLFVKSIRKLLGTVLAMCRKSGEMIVFASKIEKENTEEALESFCA